MVEELAQLKSLREIVAWIDDLGDDPDGGPVPTDAGSTTTIDVREAVLAADEPEAGRPVPARAIRATVRTVVVDPATGAPAALALSFWSCRQCATFLLCSANVAEKVCPPLPSATK